MMLPHKISRRTILAGAAAMAVAPRIARAAPPVRFAVDFTWQANHSIWTLADDLGYFRDAKLDVKVDRGYGSADNLTKLAAGALDIALVDPNLLAGFNATPGAAPMISVFIVYDAAPSAITFLKSSGIRAFKDLEGRKVSITEGSANVPLFKALCRLNGVDPDKVEYLSVSPQLRDTLVIQKRADAAVGFFTTSVINLAATGIPRDEIDYFQYNRYGLELYSLALVCRKDYADANPDAIKGFVAATMKGIKATLADPRGAVASVMKRDGLLKEQVELDRNALMNDGCILTPWVKAHGVSTIEKERFERTTGTVAEMLSAPRPAMNSIYTERFLPPLAERKIG